MTFDLSPATIEVIIAFFAPIVVALGKQSGWPNWANGVIALVIYAIFGVLAVLVQGQPIDINNLQPAIETFVVVGSVAYAAFWKNVNAEQTLTDRTSFAKAAATDTP